MFKNYYKFLFFIILIMSTILIISSNSWIITWMGLEINLMSFISLMINNKKKLSIESSIIYFIFQTISSIIFLYSILLLSLNFYYSMFFLKINLLNFTLISMMIKIGSAPFHFWVPLTMENLNWTNNLILMTWQKIAPFMLTFYCNFPNLIFLFIVFSAFIGAFIGLNQSSLKKILAYSSINQTSWLLMSLYISLMIWKIYFFIYFIILLNLTMLFNLFKIFNINQLFNLNLNFKNNMLNLFLFFSLLSTSGLPPFLGFFPKLMIIFYLVKMKMFFLIMILIISSLITMFFYLRISYASLLLNFGKSWNLYKSFKYINKINTNKLNFWFILSVSIISNFLLMIMIYLN